MLSINGARSHVDSARARLEVVDRPQGAPNSEPAGSAAAAAAGPRAAVPAVSTGVCGYLLREEGTGPAPRDVAPAISFERSESARGILSCLGRQLARTRN